MEKTIRLTEGDIRNIVKRVLREGNYNNVLGTFDTWRNQHLQDMRNARTQSQQAQTSNQANNRGQFRPLPPQTVNANARQQKLMQNLESTISSVYNQFSNLQDAVCETAPQFNNDFANLEFRFNQIQDLVEQLSKTIGSRQMTLNHK